MHNWQGRFNAFVMKRWGITIFPYSELPQKEITFGVKGVSPGVEITGDNMILAKPNASKDVDPGKAMDSYRDWVFACVHSIADEIANVQFRLFEIGSDGNHEEKFEHELLDLLDAVNDFQTVPELKHMIASHLELTGNAYLFLDGVKNTTDKPRAIYTLDPGKVKVILDKTTYPYKIKRYQFLIENRKFFYEPYEIVHIKYPDPSDPYEGVGTVQKIAMWIDSDNYAMEYNRKYFLNGIRMGPEYESDQTSVEGIESLRISYESMHQGVENAHKPVILPKGIKRSVGSVTSAKDMDFKNMLEAMQDRILAGFRVSRTILGTAESDTNRATAETADYVFSKRTIKPKMQLICSYLNERLVPRYGDNIYLSFVDPTPEDKNFRIEEMKAVSGGQPVMSVNEVRENYMGLGGVENGDTVKIAGTMVDIGEPTVDTKVKPKKGMQKEVGSGRRIKTRFARNAEVRKEMADALPSHLKKSSFRKNIYRLNLGEIAVFDVDRTLIISTDTGSRVVSPKECDRCLVTTFPIMLVQKIPYSKLQAGPNPDLLIKKFLEKEKNQILRRVYNKESVVYADSPDRVRLQEFFDNLGKSVIVLEEGKSLDIMLVERTPAGVEWLDNPSGLTVDIAIWEDIGFICQEL